MDHDEEFARTLRDRLDRAQPQIDVDVARVLPRARRRRAAVRGVTTLAMVAAFGGVGWAVGAWSPSHATDVPPAVTEPAPVATSTPPETSDAPGAPEDPAALEPGTWWYTSTTSTDAPGGVTELYVSRDQPGLIVSDGDLATATGIGPRNVIGRFRIDGEWVDMLRDHARLPTDPAALADVLRASVEPDRRSGTDDDKVFGMARDLLWAGGTLPADLRHAAWTVAASLPGATTTSGTDALGRAGEVLEYAGADGSTRLVRDPVTGFVVEEGASTVVDQRKVTVLPVEPTLESSGCTAWESC
ncbi:hypothetical protein ICW40_09440 [Actinotalea ferrariae]|uniref:hypothetical protein n=1 Tax=Actinotalea ferrariae TaxID=1386098 RepID=UPI001C8B4726|nr:hypothetical protein [Actinotalea ferrariae]MBX9245031.1 hypothetical protein [Actinotalea ferrariae]